MSKEKSAVDIHTNLARRDQGEISFNKHDIPLSEIIKWIDDKKLAKPTLQRDYKWTLPLVTELIKSLYCGYPIGTIYLWENEKYDTVPLSTNLSSDKQQNIPTYLIIDGQQRILSLYAVFRGQPIYQNGKELNIKIAYNPIHDEFSESSSLIEKDSDWVQLNNINHINSEEERAEFFVKYMNPLRERYLIDQKNEQIIQGRILSLIDLKKRKLESIIIPKDVGILEVATIFNGINSGKPLTLSDVIFSVTSTFDSQIKERLEDFSRQSMNFTPKERTAWNNIGYGIKTDQLLHILISITYYAPMSAVKQKLDLSSKSKCETEVRRLHENIDRITNLDNWHSFIGLLEELNIVSESCISNRILVNICYVYYLCAIEYNIPKQKMRQFIKKWFMFALLTNRYRQGQSEISNNELTKIKRHQSDFIQEFYKDIDAELTTEFWTKKFPQQLLNMGIRGNKIATYFLSLMEDNVPVMFSKYSIRDYYKNEIKEKNVAIDKHHIFPYAKLKDRGYDKKLINTIVNVALLERPKNIKIKDDDPLVWLHSLGQNKEDLIVSQMKNYDFPLPANSDYKTIFNYDEFQVFLDNRSHLMAQRIKRFFEKL